MKLEIWCGWAHPYKTIAKYIVHSIVYRYKMGLDARKPAFAIYNKLRLIQSPQLQRPARGLKFSPEASLDMIL